MTVSLAITIDQPYPALIVAGVMGWETRGNPPAGEMCPPGVRPLPGCAIERGERIARHADAIARHTGRGEPSAAGPRG